MEPKRLLKYLWQRRLLRTLAIATTIVLGYQYLILPRMLRWGASRTELNRTFPGDELVLNKDYQNTIVVTVQAPASQIWPWVAQMGLHRGGFYSFTFLENLFGCKLKNARSIHSEWQNPQVGYYEGVCQSAVNKHMPGWIIAIVEPPKTLVWKGAAGEWMMGVYIDSVNKNTSRL